MKVELKIKKTYDIKEFIVQAKPRYWEDTLVNRMPDTQNGDRIPCKMGNIWHLIIDVETGIIKNWTKGITADVHYKCDEGTYKLMDDKGECVVILENSGTPAALSPKENGFGCYIIMHVDEHGKIEDWEADFEDFNLQE